MSLNKANWVKTVVLSLAIAMLLSACQDEAPATATDAAQPVDEAPDTTVAAPAPSLTGAVPTVGGATNERQLMTITSCNIELANSLSMDGEVPSVPGAADIKLVGWFVEQSGLNIGEPLVLKISNFDQSQYWDVPVTLRTERQDIVAAYKNNANLAKAGFDVTLNLSQFPKGRYNVYLSHTLGSTDQVCGQGRSINVD